MKSAKSPRSLLFMLLLFSCSLVYGQESASAAGYVPQKEVLLTLQNLLQQVRELKSQHVRSTAELSDWKNRCGVLENQLEEALKNSETLSQDLADSERTVIDLLQKVSDLTKDLQALKTASLNTSVSLAETQKQKNIWRNTGLVSLILAVIELVAIVIMI